MKITDEAVNAAYNCGKALHMTGSPGDFRAVLNAALPHLSPEPSAARKLALEDAAEWHREDSDRSVLLYTSRQYGWSKGRPLMSNDVTIKIERAHGSETNITAIADAIMSALSRPAPAHADAGKAAGDGRLPMSALPSASSGGDRHGE